MVSKAITAGHLYISILFQISFSGNCCYRFNLEDHVSQTSRHSVLLRNEENLCDKTRFKLENSVLRAVIVYRFHACFVGSTSN